MAIPKADNSVLDATLAKIATSTTVYVCSAEPANQAGIAAVSLGSYTITAGTGNGDWLIANGDVSGRKVSLLAQSGNNASADGTADCLVYSDGTTLLYATDSSDEALNNGSPFTIGAYDVAELRAPVNE